VRPKPIPIVLSMLICTLVLFAQQNTKVSEDANIRSVSGLVTDASGQPVSGAVVQLKDTKSLLIRSYITQQDGRYHFSALSTNVDYELKAAREGSTSAVKRLSLFSGNRAPVVNLKLSK